MKKIIHIITGLNSGGAESMLYKLIKYSDKTQYYHEVISLMDEGVIGEKIKGEGVRVHSLNLNKKNLISSVIKAIKICKNFDIVNTWLYHADIIGFLIAKIFLSKRLIWNIRHSNLDKDSNKSRTLKIVKLNCYLSKYVDFVTYNSESALENHYKAGYLNENSIVIPNGFELDRFQHDLESRQRIRGELGLNENQKVIITVGRWNIQKDYYTLLKALKKLKENNKNFKMLMCGTNLDLSNKELLGLINSYQLEENIILLGRRDDIPGLLSAADIYVSSSLGESFSNSIGEAMACELPCVVTNVGDSKKIIGDYGIAVESKDFNALSDSILSFIENKNINRIGKNARLRIKAQYDIKSIIIIFESLFANNNSVDEKYSLKDKIRN
jgi:glycosyltransferase involved in cell wall biosynthesis